MPRSAPNELRRKASDLVGVLGGWLYLRKTDPTFTITPDDLAERNMPAPADVRSFNRVNRVLQTWRAATEEQRATGSEHPETHAARDLLSAALSHLMSPGRGGFEKCDSWLRSLPGRDGSG
ncbi:hypothetical protein [Streptomyces sp. NPDC059786]|uniref:hypothetical protein n=1 Tax=Streptomyces sp. NPDC059786 TaxID=3346946 RepID=UPI003656787E